MAREVHCRIRWRKGPCRLSCAAWVRHGSSRRACARFGGASCAASVFLRIIGFAGIGIPPHRPWSPRMTICAHGTHPPFLCRVHAFTCRHPGCKTQVATPLSPQTIRSCVSALRGRPTRYRSNKTTVVFQRQTTRIEHIIKVVFSSYSSARIFLNFQLSRPLVSLVTVRQCPLRHEGVISRWTPKRFRSFD